LETVTSRQNAAVKTFRALGSARAPQKQVLLDGVHLVEEALASGVPIPMVAFASRLLAPAANPTGRLLAARLERAGTRVLVAGDALLAAMSPVRTPSGVVAIAEPRRETLEHVIEGPAALAVFLVEIQDPGNVGAIIRTAEAAGATGIAACEATADPFGWKALRGAMGSTFRLPVAPGQSVAPAVAAARARGLQVLATGPRGGRGLYEVDLTQPCAVLLGGEGAGLAPDVTAVADEVVTIPMRKPVESLNVAISAAIVLYEAVRQRSERRTRRGNS
jgi:TrmH family RNA methyltransferase